ncbi:MAG: hypothetical protein JNG85_09370, partial [Spirochaetaceae bacterium]|nr:hypothetical protein [Spirochaetaceae bacterium]
GIKAFWPSRRLVVDFMSHTYSRTKALFGEFAASLDEADAIVLHKIYASAREAPDPSLSGSSLFEAAAARRAAARRAASRQAGGSLDADDRPTALYFEEPRDALEPLADWLRPGDLFLTMGAGDNWQLGAALYERFKEQEGTR